MAGLAQLQRRLTSKEVSLPDAGSQATWRAFALPNDSLEQSRLPRIIAKPVASSAEVVGIAQCPVCQGMSLTDRPNNLTLCGDCRHVFQSDLRVSMVYDAGYAHQYDRRPHEELSRIRWNFIRHHLPLPAGSKILDIGYGNGAFLKHARRAGIRVFGIDLHGEDFGIPEVTYDSSIDFDLICFFDSIEHFPEFSQIFGLKTKNVIVSIPDPPDFLLSRPTHWRHYKPGEHLHYFSRESLDLLLCRWGLTVKIAEGHPEDELRGKLWVDRRTYDNIYTAIYSPRRGDNFLG
jgi:SAM-dependent methyltransferase